MRRCNNVTISLLSGCLALSLSACGDSAKSATPSMNDNSNTTDGTSSETSSMSSSSSNTSGGAGSSTTDAGSTGGSTSTTGGTTDASACGSLSADEAATIITTNLEHVLQTSSDSLAFIETSLVLPRALDGSAEPLDYKTDFDQWIVDLIDDLENRILHADNVSEVTQATVLYDLQPEVVCEEPEPNPDDLIAEEEALADYNDCLTSMMETPIGLEVTRIDCDAGDNVSIVVLVGEERYRPVTLQLYTSEMSAQVDFANLVPALQAYGDLAEDTTISPETSGQLSARVSATDTANTSFTLSIDTPIHWASTSADIPTNIDLSTTGEVLTLTSSLAEQSITGNIALGALDYGMPLDSFIDSFFQREVPEPGTEQVLMSISGFTSNLEYTGADDTLQLTNLGLGSGPTTATYQGSTLLQIDVNAAASRRLDVAATSSTTDPLRLAIDPGFDLDIEYALEPLANLVTDLQSFARDDTVSIALTGNAPLVVLSENVDGYVSLLDDVSGTLLSVQSGTLSLSSRTLPDENINVETGQCLERLDSAVGSHEFLAELAAQTCP